MGIDMVDIFRSTRTLFEGALHGRCLAVELAQVGAELMLVARREKKLKDLAGQLRPAGHKLEFLAGDVTDPAIRSEALRVAAANLGGLDILINNAGVSAHGRFADASPASQSRRASSYRPVTADRAACSFMKWSFSRLPSPRPTPRKPSTKREPARRNSPRRESKTAR